jgi:xanthine/CO dehydrogenase XdhC/CoxF family maturation factor
MTHPLDAPLALLARDFRELQARDVAFVLATVVATEGSTYRKAGAQMLIDANAELRGLLSGGCLEVDLVQHAREILVTGVARLISYDMRGPDDLLFGMGSGCEGAMQILLQRVGAEQDWQPLTHMAVCSERRSRETLALIVDGPAAGRCWWEDGGNAPWPEPPEVRAVRAGSLAAQVPKLIQCVLDQLAARVLILPLVPPPALLLLGGGADAVPLASLAVGLGFAVTVSDHRPALAVAARFPQCDVRCIVPAELASTLDLGQFDAAVVMSHYLPADLAYLRALAANPAVGYVGLLGPAARRERLLAELGDETAGLGRRLRAPVGLDIGARTPEAIAIATIAEIHAWLARASARPWHEARDAGPR